MENDDAPDFTVDDLALLKELFLAFEKTVDEVKLPNALAGETFTGGYIFSLLEKANVRIFFLQRKPIKTCFDQIKHILTRFIWKISYLELQK